MSKEAFPFDPFQDSLLGEVLLQAWLNLSQDPEILKNYITQDNSIKHTFTPNVKKQILMNTLPQEIRRLINLKDNDSILKLMKDLANGRGEFTKERCLDVVFELLEWLWTGFPDESVIMSVIDSLYDHPPAFFKNTDLETEMRKLYDSLLAEPLS
jgi:hypothetical protein